MDVFDIIGPIMVDPSSSHTAGAARIAAVAGMILKMEEHVMKAYLIEQPNKGILKDVLIPVPADNEILLEVKAAGVCGTDIHIFKGEYFGGYPRIPGHEFSGIVNAIGKKVTKFEVGQHVAADPNIFCESCDQCKENLQNFCVDMHAVGVTRHGAFAQYLTVPEQCVFDISGMTFTEAALVEPLACVVYGQEKAGVPLGSSVLIIGAGPIGLMHLQLARINGAAEVTVVDLFEHKLALATKLGADKVYSASDFENMNHNNKYELVIDCTGVPKVVEASIKYVKDSGTMLFFGVCPDESAITINPYEIFKRELRLMGTFALKKTFGKALKLAKSKKIDLPVLVGKRLTLGEVPKFFDNLESENPGLKTLIYPNGIIE